MKQICPDSCPKHKTHPMSLHVTHTCIKRAAVVISGILQIGCLNGEKSWNMKQEEGQGVMFSCVTLNNFPTTLWFIRLSTCIWQYVPTLFSWPSVHLHHLSRDLVPKKGNSFHSIWWDSAQFFSTGIKMFGLVIYVVEGKLEFHRCTCNQRLATAQPDILCGFLVI